MNNVNLRVVIQLAYFILVLTIKLVNHNSEYFQVILSMILTMLFIPFNRYVNTCVEQQQLIFKSLCVDLGLINDGFLSRFQYFWLGLTIQLEFDSTIQNQIVRVGYLLVVIASANLTSIYLLIDSSAIGIIFGEALYGLLLLYQFIVKTNQQVKKLPLQKPCSHSFTEKIESPQQQIFDEDSNQIKFMPLNQGLGKNSSLYSRDPSVLEQIEQQKTFYEILFNQFPEGILIINDQNKIDYHNNQVYNLLGRKHIQNRQDQILPRLYELKNYSSKFQFEEQAQFDKFFSNLDKKLKFNQREYNQPFDQQFDQQINNENSKESIFNNNFDDNQTDYYFQAELSKAETLKQELDKALSEKVTEKNGLSSPFQRQQSFPSQRTYKGQDKIKFSPEVKKMLCMIEESSEDHDNELQEDKSQSECNTGLLIQITIKPYIYENKRSVLLLIRDVSLFNQFKVLQQQNKNKSRMLAYVSHELRNPLGAIIEINQQLKIQFQQDNNLISKYLQPLQSSAISIQGLANDLLDLAQLKAGKFNLTCKDFSIYQLLNDAISIMQYPVSLRNLKLDLQYDDKIPQIINSDSQRIQQIIFNLISNATKFTKVGGITVTAKLLQPKLIEICVEDTGVGLKPEDKNKLFQPFGKLEDTKNMNTSGVGLGLMISNVLAQKLSGNDEGLQVDSKGVDKGTRFVFKIQDVSENQASTPKESKALIMKESSHRNILIQKRFEDLSMEPLQNCKCPKIIIADDEPINLQTLGWKLDRMKYTYLKAQSGQECIEILQNWYKNQDYCCNWIKFIILDINMPYLNGYQTSKLVRQMEVEKQVKRCKIIGCSGFTDNESKRVGFESGMDIFISKPIEDKELQSALQQLQ
ncbi:unnamed protein product (macronuclear) [Paramecium tetraurelia]|uniref:Uncharacterized protein n=1 Tax=Paramecium tetraurelia TaxID=5888 RepID=A0CG83_PARTE|nr:uncharacterized protein GSPATT00038245001 [Paramecium tetraurelia]CAK69800.1 unnamed protein product [Paramecium tetraurelia]|eukprot:XP_001437197.1 hypothetical protein (macronuclear) [Paramecium tetraurelia strain d4-2]